jgi:hypothetical protein
MNRLTSILRLAQRLPVFPCKATDKSPLVGNGFYGATSDFHQIKEWWAQWPEALPGVPAGNRFVVIDPDMYHADAAEWYEQHRARLPVTRTHKTRRGGGHLLFKPDARIHCTQNKLGPHVDTKGIGGYIIWWPVLGFEVEHASVLAAVPEWIAAKLAPAPPKPRPSQPIRLSNDRFHNKLFGVLAFIARAREGERNARTFWGACRLAEMVNAGQLSAADALALTIEAASRTGLPQDEARRAAQSAFRRSNNA